jgi:hypothetical protein
MDLGKILSQLPPSLDKLGFSSANNEIYLQHIPEAVDLAQSQFIQYCVDNGYLPKEFLEKKVHRQGIVGRYLDDSKSELSKIWYRFYCIDEKYREWEQPYYAINYAKHEDGAICVNKQSPLVIQYFREKNIDLLLN